METYQEKLFSISDEFFQNIFFLYDEVADLNARSHNQKFAHDKKIEDYFKKNNINIDENNSKIKFKSYDDFKYFNKFIEDNKLHVRRLEIINNAHFIYANVIFENFLNRLVKLALHNDENIYKRFANDMVEKAEALAKNGNTELIRKLPDRDKLIEEFDKQGSLIQLTMKILRIEVKNEYFLDYYFSLVNIKELRNLLVHRGGKIDDDYKNAVQRYTKRFQSQSKFLKDIFNLKSGTPFSITPNNFMGSLEILFFWGNIYNFTILKSNMEEKSFMTDIIHRAMIKYLEDKGKFGLITMSIDTAYAIYKYFFKSDLRNMNDEDVFNLILLQNLIFEDIETFHLGPNQDIITDKYQKERPRSFIRNKPKDKNDKNEIIKEFYNQSLDAISNQNIKNLCSNYLAKNYDNLVSSIEIYLRENNLGLNDIKEWYMIKSLENKKNFQNKLKKSNLYFLKDSDLYIQRNENSPNEIILD